MKIHLDLLNTSSDVVIERGSLYSLNEYLNLSRKALIVTDSGVPEKYAKAVASQCEQPFIFTFEQGEKSKNLSVFESVCKALLNNGFTRSDCCIAVGGGVVTDITGFAAACYMRGIEFYNIPTTLLCQVDASVGGKTAVDFMGVKNIIGAFHQPSKVVIDPDTLSTLDKRQLNNGMAEVIKTAALFDSEMFDKIETQPFDKISDYLIERCVRLKADVVIKDEKEQGLRKVLNFGHTVGHAVESLSGMLHGESVAVGMTYMCAPNVKERLVNVLKKYSLPFKTDLPYEKIISLLMHDKKMKGDRISVVYCPEIGSFKIKDINTDEFIGMLRGELK
ncbi:MAG: 3-dehydroquinate synthase [Clostridiales bacterium]|nr:3-dehydroquinate synthase [Clostridiales bacterium]